MTYGKKFWSDGTIVAGQQFEYTFDDIGNRKTTRSGGDAAGSNLRLAAYAANTVNQYTTRSVPIYADVFGTANASATVTVNNQTSYRRGDYFRKELTVNNLAGPVWLGVTNVGVRPGAGAGGLDIVTTNQGHLLVSKNAETLSYDEDGNMTGDSVWNYTYDAENRIIAKESQATVPPAARRRLEYALDHQGQRVRTKVYDWNPATQDYQLSTDHRFVYAGWELLAELEAANDAVTRSFVWGLDLSGTRTGAGGVGGLLLVTSHASPVTSHFLAYDGNGNVTALVNAADGTETARYEYDPFGQLLRATGPLARLNPFRFSTKWHEDETGDVHYEYRDYRPSLGSWLSRDPIGELGGYNLYGFVGNNSVNAVDRLGQKQYTIWVSAFIMPPTITFPYFSLIPLFVDPSATYLGNGRGFGPGPLSPFYSKMAHEVVIDSNPSKPAVVSNGAVGGFAAVWFTSPNGPGSTSGISPTPALARVTRPSRCITKVVINGSVNNPVVPGSLSIDYSYTIVFDSSSGVATVNGTHDRYPWQELYINQVWFVRDTPDGVTRTPADLWQSKTIAEIQFGIPRECCSGASGSW